MTDLFDLMTASKLAGDGDPSDYSSLSNKPQINGNTLSGNKSSSALGIVEPSMSSSGDIYFGAVCVARVMDEASYTALQTKENIFYLTYPTPSASLSRQESAQEEPVEPEEEELRRSEDD